MPTLELVETDTGLQTQGVFIEPMAIGVGLNPQETLAMKRLIAGVVLVVVLLTSGVVGTQSGLVGTAYADSGAGGD
jgi:hypothetical protein